MYCQLFYNFRHKDAELMDVNVKILASPRARLQSPKQTHI
ncbi:hypothetical protein IFVP203_C2200001 [Vibrio parahaemolyticus]